jgi:hypothetical protein
MMVAMTVQVTLVVMPASNVVVTMTNTGLGDYLYAQFGIGDAADKFEAFYLDSGEEIVYEFSVVMGKYFISGQWWVENRSRYQSFDRSGSVSLFETEEALLTLGLW